jgi:transcriptional regulator with XRE-family HTH domain
MTPTLQKLRIKAVLTPAEVASGVGVTTAKYLRWEAEKEPVPEAKREALAQVLGVSVEELDGEAAPFHYLQFLGTPKEQTYYGEVSIHFASGANLLMSITQAEHERIVHQLDDWLDLHDTLVVSSLDNRIALIRRSAIDDVFFASDDSDTRGPDEYALYGGIEADDDIWLVLENADCLDDAEMDTSQKKIDQVKAFVQHSEFENESDRKHHEERLAALMLLSSHVIIRYSSSRERQLEISCDDDLSVAFSAAIENVGDDKDFYELFCEELDQTLYLRKQNLDYITIPKHKYNIAQYSTNAELVG